MVDDHTMMLGDNDSINLGEKIAASGGGGGDHSGCCDGDDVFGTNGSVVSENGIAYTAATMAAEKDITAVASNNHHQDDQTPAADEEGGIECISSSTSTSSAAHDAAAAAVVVVSLSPSEDLNEETAIASTATTATTTDEAEDDDPDHQCQLWSNNNTLDDEDDHDTTDEDCNNNSSSGSSNNNNNQQYSYGDIWSTDAFGLFATHDDLNSTSSLRALLDSNNYSLVDLLAHEELLQELRGCNEPRLMEYLSRPDSVAGLVECLLLGWKEDDTESAAVGGVAAAAAGGGSNGRGGGLGGAMGEKERKERWCAMEVQRRQKEREERRRRSRQQKQKKKKLAIATATDALATEVITTLFDISTPRQLEEELRVEAQWNSPPTSDDPITDHADNNHIMSQKTASGTATTTIAQPSAAGGNWPLHQEEEEDDDDNEDEKSIVLRTPEEEYDVQFIRYPYMACEVLCSDACGGGGTGSMLNVLVDGYVNEVVGGEDDDGLRHHNDIDHDHNVIINDDEDSLLDYDHSHLLGGGVTKDADDSDDNDNDLDSIHLDKKDEILEKSDCNSCDVDGDSTNGKATTSLRTQLAMDITPTIGDSQHLQELRHRHHCHHEEQQAQPRQIRILDLLFAVLIDTPPSSLDDRRAGYFEKILNVLFQKRSQAMSDYMNTQLIFTDASADMARQMLVASMSLGDGVEGVEDPTSNSACDNAIVEPSSSYVSLSQQRSMDESNSNNDDGANDHKSECKFPIPGAPPMLMCALFDHLHSYPIMHIVQRLLMPSPLRRQQVISQTKDAKGGSSGDITRSEENTIGTSSKGGDEDNDDNECEVDDQINDPMNQIFQCDWLSRKTDQALELLLRRLAGDTSSFLLGYGYPVGYDVTNCGCDDEQQQQQHRTESISESDRLRHEDDLRIAAQEAALLCSQHASEILTAIIQNSSLDAPVMMSLSSDPSLQRIIDLIVLPPFSKSISNESDVDFVAHESIMTCAINVLESLVLQLGGYGAVVATSGPIENEEGDNVQMKGENPKDLGPSASSKSQSNLLPPPTVPLLSHLTRLLTRLSEVLNDPITDTWVGPSQYSGSQQRLLLGASRLRIVRLIESLVLLGDLEVDLALQKSDCLEKCIDLFWQFEWCSMLHQSVANFLVHVFEGGDSRSGLQEYFLVRCKLMERLMDSFEFEDTVPSTPKYHTRDDKGTTEGGMWGQLIEKDSGSIEPRYGEMMLAMKSMFVAKGTSSMESVHGSQSDESAIEEDDGDAVAPVSEDDVDSAMEKECQDGHTDLSINISLTPLPQGTLPSQQVRFRRGFMGHVIIICQALVHACKNADAEHGNDTGATSVQEATPLNDDTSTTLSNIPPSTVEEESNVVTQSPNKSESDQLRKLSSIDEILRNHPLFDKWQKFVTFVLVPEMSVQSTPLCGQPAPSSLNQMIPPVTHDDAESELFEIDVDGSQFINNGSMGEFIVGEIDMDENDLDTAATMIEALRVGNKRRRRASGDETAVSIANFGSTIHQPGGFKDYVYDYDDPLGHLHPFENGDCNDEGDEHGYGESHNDSDDEGFMSDAMVVSKEGIVAKQGRQKNINGSIIKSGSESSDEEEDDDDNHVPVLDLFAGSFEPNFANFDAFEGDVVNGDDSFVSNDHGNDNNSSREAFFDAINGCIGHPTTDDLFEFSDTPFDLVDTLSTDAEIEKTLFADVQSTHHEQQFTGTL